MHAPFKGFFRYYFIAIGLIATPLHAQNKPLSEYPVHDYSSLIGMPGFSKEQLQMHFKLYAGYVKNTNTLLARLKELELDGKQTTIDYGALKRCFGWEWDGMRLHEYYFENLGGHQPLEATNTLHQALVQEFGSFEAWKKQFIATGMIRGIGWSVLYRDRQTGKLFNVWINEHDLGNLAGGDPILVMDVFEHAYITQYGLDRSAYINAFFENINWETVAKRYQNSVATSTPPA